MVIVRLVLQARRKKKEFRVKPATSFYYFQYQDRENIIQQYLSPSEYFSKQIAPKVSDPTILYEFYKHRVYVQNE